jgi:N-acetylmuramoyl-L-alanine amidase
MSLQPLLIAAAGARPSRTKPAPPSGGFGAARAARRLGLSFACLSLLAVPLAAEQLRVTFEDGRPERQLPLSRIEANSLEWFVSANALAIALDLERFWRPETRKLVLKLGERRVQVSVDTRLVLDDGRDVLLHVPVRYQRGSVMLPLEFLKRVLDPSSDSTLRFDRERLALHVGRTPTDVARIDYRIESGDTEVHIHMSRSFRHRVQATSRELIRVRIFDAQIDPLAVAAERPEALIRSVRAEQRSREAVIYLELDDRVDDYESRTRNRGRTIVVSLRRPLESMPLPEFKLPEPAALDAPRDGKRCATLVIDAGHGGTDAGVQGSGLVEKDVTLELASRLKRRLRRSTDLRVELLRDADRAIADDRRAELANKMSGDLLVSLHCNGWFDRQASGFEVLFVGPQAMLRTTGGAGNHDESDFRPWKSAQLPFAGRSEVFANMLQVELGGKLGIPNRGARESDVDFLKGIAMPAVLVELGFLTNPDEADALAAPAFADALADAIAAAVERYCVQYEAGELDGQRFGIPNVGTDVRGATRR